MRNARTNASMTSLFFANVLYWVCAGVYSPFLSAHYTSLGLSAAQTGILLAATPVCALAIQPLWSTIADKLGRPRRGHRDPLPCGGGTRSAVLPGVDVRPGPSRNLCVLGVFLGAPALSDSLVIELADRSGLDFSRIRMGGTIGYAIVVLIVGRLLDMAPQIQFAVVSAALVVFAGSHGGASPRREFAPMPRTIPRSPTERASSRCLPAMRSPSSWSSPSSVRPRLASSGRSWAATRSSLARVRTSWAS